MELIIYIAIICAVIFRLVIMKGTFILPTFYRNGSELTFNLGSITTIIIGIGSALALAFAQPERFATWWSAALVAYTAPQVTDAVITAGTRFKDGRDQQKEKVDEDDYDGEVA